jgi:DNA modification methylase
MMHLLACANALRLPLADRSVHTVVTSPPYFRARDYGHAGQIGHEPTVEEYVAKLVAVFREAWRVLRPTGTLWLNIGDTYAKKQLLGIPWRLAFALQDDGWILRSELIWSKSNPMPESVRDRPSRSHEAVFLFARQRRYFYDPLAIAEPSKELTRAQSDHRPVRNARSVWTIPAVGYKGAHFAIMPLKLARKCIKAGTSRVGCCAACGAPYRRVVDRQRVPTRPGHDSKVYVDPLGSPYLRHSGSVIGNRDPKRHVTTPTTIGWKPTCKCGAEVVPCVVFDPFAGSGTTLVAAEALGRDGIGFDLRAEYLNMAERRISRPHARIVTPRTEPDRPLFAGLDDSPSSVNGSTR